MSPLSKFVFLSFENSWDIYNDTWLEKGMAASLISHGCAPTEPPAPRAEAKGGPEAARGAWALTAAAWTCAQGSTVVWAACMRSVCASGALSGSLSSGAYMATAWLAAASAALVVALVLLLGVPGSLSGAPLHPAVAGVVATAGAGAAAGVYVGY